jgi:hypothetical protein
MLRQDKTEDKQVSVFRLRVVLVVVLEKRKFVKRTEKGSCGKFWSRPDFVKKLPN